MESIGILSDIHGNYEALKAVFGVLEEMGIGQLLCAGDIVGYGPSPSACVECLREHDVTAVLGNHDAAVAGRVSLGHFPGAIGAALEWTQQNISRSEIRYLADLPESMRLNWGVLIHGSPLQPLWHSVSDAGTAFRVLRVFDEPVYITGHSHQPAAFRYENSKVKIQPVRVRRRVKAGGREEGRIDKVTIRLKPGCRYLLNAGSVGQPRDGDWRACFAVLDLMDDQPVSMTWVRVAYDIEETRREILEKGLPVQFGERLLVGR